MVETFIFKVGEEIVKKLVSYALESHYDDRLYKGYKTSEYDPVFKELYPKCEYFVETIRSMYNKFHLVEGSIDFTEEINRILELYPEIWKIYIVEHRSFSEKRFYNIFEQISKSFDRFYKLISKRDLKLEGKEYFSVDLGCKIFVAIVETGKYVDILRRMVW